MFEGALCFANDISTPCSLIMTHRPSTSPGSPDRVTSSALTPPNRDKCRLKINIINIAQLTIFGVFSTNVFAVYTYEFVRRFSEFSHYSSECTAMKRFSGILTYVRTIWKKIFQQFALQDFNDDFCTRDTFWLFILPESCIMYIQLTFD